MSLECAAICVGCARIFANVVDLIGAALQCVCILPLWILYALALPFCTCYERLRGTNGTNGTKREEYRYTNPMRSDSVSSASTTDDEDDQNDDEGFYTVPELKRAVGEDKLRL